MDSTTNTQPTPTNEKTSLKKKNKEWIKWLLIILALLLLLGAAAYFWWQWQECRKNEESLKKDKQQLQSQIDTLSKADSTTAETPAAACTDSPTAFYKENIKAALDTKNTAVFATYTSNPVKVVFAASEKGGNETPDQAAQSMEYTHSATGPWDFNLPAATIAHYDAGFYTNYFDANTYVGQAASGMVAAFDFDCSGKINQIFIAADDGLL
jgi:hypothetical protein